MDITCSKCNITKNITEFRTDNSHKLGIHPHCRECYNENQRNYRKKNKDSYNKKALDKYNKNKEKINARRRALYHKKKKNPNLKKSGGAKKQKQKLLISREGWKKKKEKSWEIAGIINFTYADFKKLEKKQNGKCAICNKPPKTTMLSVDHNHKTGKARELLCYNCNAALGMCKENTETLLNMINYIKKYE